MVVFAWVDKGRRYFVATSESLEEGEAMLKHRLRHIAADMN